MAAALAAMAAAYSLAAAGAAPLAPDDQGIFSVASFGARGDGTTDDTAACQAAIDAAVAAGGGSVVWPRRGPYLLSAPLVLCASANRSLESDWPPSSTHFYSGITVTLSSPARAVLRASPGGPWPSFGSNTSSAMLNIGVRPDGSGCSLTPLYTTVQGLQFEGPAPFTPSAWGGDSPSLPPPSYPLTGPKAAILADWAYGLTIRRCALTNVNVGLYLKGVDNCMVQSTVIRANIGVIAEDCGDSTFQENDIYPFGWGFILRGWSGNSLLLRNTVTGQPISSGPGCALAKIAYPTQPTR